MWVRGVSSEPAPKQHRLYGRGRSDYNDTDVGSILGGDISRAYEWLEWAELEMGDDPLAVFLFVGAGYCLDV